MIIRKCNMCGKLLDEFEVQDNLFIDEAMGYGSSYDGEHIRVDFCQHCFDEIIDKCVISPINSGE